MARAVIYDDNGQVIGDFDLGPTFLAYGDSFLMNFTLNDNGVSSSPQP